MTEFALAAGASGAKLRLRELTKAFGATTAVDKVSLDVPAGAFVSLATSLSAFYSPAVLFPLGGAPDQVAFTGRQFRQP
jgi:hypothetical protein